MPKHDSPALPGNEDVGLYVLALQEVVDINSTTEALRPYTDPAVAKKWREELESALPKGYRFVAEQQLIGLLLLIYASADVADDVRFVSTTSVGTGLMGYMGNKGATTARLVLGDTTRLVFVNCHLAAGADKTALDRRNWDAAQISQRTRFDPIEHLTEESQPSGEYISDADFAFWVGDLNYRLQTIPGDDVRRLLMLHTRNESIQSLKDDSATDTRSVVSSATPDDELDPSEDPASLQTTLTSLLPHDELHLQMKHGKAFHDGWREGPIAFLPTYKYDVGSVGVFDSSDKKRAPSWCDRILYRTRRDKLAYDARVKEAREAKKKEDEMQANGTFAVADDDDILYDYDPDADGMEGNDDYDENDGYDETNDGVLRVTTKEGFDDEIRLEYYTAHQRVLSSDHKPLDAVFSLKYDSVVPELKARVHAEVAKDLDKAENEGRPNVTVVVDQHDKTTDGSQGVDFGDVKWNQVKHRTLTIANTSRVPARLSFLGRPSDGGEPSGIAPDWLRVKLNDILLSNVSTGTDPITLVPGETASVELEIQVADLGLVRELNDSHNHLDDTLVLRVEDGRDHFIPMRANWQETSLGRAIDKLVRIPEGGIRKLQHQRPDRTKSRDIRFSAPRELFRLTEAIEELGIRIIAEWDMIAPESEVAPWLQWPGWPFDQTCWTEWMGEGWNRAISEACDALDSDQSLTASLPAGMPAMQRLYVLANLLVMFLQSIPEGLIDENLWHQIDHYFAENDKTKRKSTEDEQRTALQEILSHSPSRNISFILLLTLLERLLQETASTSAAKEPATPTSPLAKVAGGTLQRVKGTFARGSAASQGEQARAALSRIFAGVLFSEAAGESKKSHGVQDRRRVEMLELFLRKDATG
ncbi:Endonuclease/exonuclease/phosphatase [Neohortaea acidophila]|uniref:Endonuclease/exonuclease/phosphatase n=1 Tax=Neohortaea acidophila TaxID=245834 RepID=A0A6A6Q038_9PEZI|nr:Endonuclease/exonuclease/phosphatase [Neohortaea acidophila]KAF2484787.1 Endonuclease/exonuclease/phosphatase [Neohortaea acidophila]